MVTQFIAKKELYYNSTFYIKNYNIFNCKKKNLNLRKGQQSDT